MFGKKTCKKCGKKTEKGYSYCPYCGNYSGKKDPEDYGMIGMDDEIEAPVDPFANALNGLGGISGGIFNKMFGNAIKMLEKEIENEMKQNRAKNQNQNLPNMPQRTNFEIIINGKRINPENIKFAQKVIPAQKEEPTQKRVPKMSTASLKKMSKLPKKEPATNIRRLSNKVIYELEIPGVKSLEDLSITKLENSIEIKALAKDKAYSKLIPINLPILNYELADGKLILELDAKN